MDLLLMICQKIWHLFTITGFDVVFQGITYHITLFAILTFTIVTGIAIRVLFSLFE